MSPPLLDFGPISGAVYGVSRANLSSVPMYFFGWYSLAANFSQLIKNIKKLSKKYHVSTLKQNLRSNIHLARNDGGGFVAGLCCFTSEQAFKGVVRYYAASSSYQVTSQVPSIGAAKPLQFCYDDVQCKMLCISTTL